LGEDVCGARWGLSPTTPNYTRTASPKGRMFSSLKVCKLYKPAFAGRQAFNFTN